MLANKKVTMAVSLIIAIIVWGLVIGEVNPTISITMKELPVQLLSEDMLSESGLAISGEKNFSVDVVVEGKRAELAAIGKADIIISANLAGCSEGENYIPLKVNAPGNVLVTEVRSQNILVNVEPRLSVYSDIKIKYSGDIASGYEPAYAKAEPAQVEVSGAKSIVSKVAYIKADAAYADIDEEADTYQLKLTAVDESGEEVEGVSLSNYTCNAVLQLFSVKTVQLIVDTAGQAPEGLTATKTILPDAAIKIKGRAADIADIEQIVCEPIDISLLSEGSNEIGIDVPLPEGVYLSNSNKKISAEVVLEPLEELSPDDEYGDGIDTEAGSGENEENDGTDEADKTDEKTESSEAE